VANRAINKFPEVDIILLLSTLVLPVGNWLMNMLAGIHLTGGVLGGKVVSLRGEILHFGYELFELPYAGGLETYLTPHGRFR
jgi:hypothetical protein